MRKAFAACVVLAIGLAGCAADKPEVAGDLTVALDVAATIEGAYAARPDADPTKIAELSRLLASAQAAVVAWRASSLPADQALASAAISALVEYEASAAPTS
jgi:hypothetical protein